MPRSILDFIMAYEDGNVTEKELYDGFQLLIDDGIVWGLQGHYGRLARYLIDAGHCAEAVNPNR